MMEKFFKNPLYTGIATMLILVVVVAFVYDNYKNTKKDFYGMLSPTAVATV
jgi:putative effector of murein hydrolase